MAGRGEVVRMAKKKKESDHCVNCGRELPPPGAVYPVDKDGGRLCEECEIVVVDPAEVS